MRIGVYVPSLAADVGGGFTFSSDLLSAVLARSPDPAHEFVVLTRDRPELLPPLSLPVVSLTPPRAAGLDRFVRLSHKARGRAPGISRTEARFRQLVVDAGIDVIWCLAPGTPVHDVPYITVVWDLPHRLQPYFPEVSSGMEWESRDNFYRRELQRASVVVTGTTEGRSEIERFYGVSPERIRLLPHPTPSFVLEAIDAPPPPALPLAALQDGYLLYPAQFWPHKNHVGLLLALRHLLERGHALHLVLVGSDKGNRATVLRSADALGVAPHVHDLGFVSRDELVRLYRHAVAMPYVSFFGPENLPPLEAFALGCPVVAAHVSGSESQLASAALLVDPADPADIADAVQRVLLDTELRAQLVAAGHDRARSFTPSHFVEGVVAICDELAPVIRTWTGVDT